jgi:hypothetical protein
MRTAGKSDNFWQNPLLCVLPDQIYKSKLHRAVSFEVLTAVCVFWDVTMRRWVSGSRRFERKFAFILIM